MKKIIMAAIVMSCSIGCWAQINIKGKVKTTNGNQVVEFANVVLQNPDSTFIQGVSTDEKGFFQVDNIEAGDYQISISSMGYIPSVVSLMGLTKSLDLGDIFVEPATVSLEEVTVSASAVRNHSDRRIVFPTGQQISSSTNGINLLAAMMLPRLEVNPLTNEVKLANEGVVQFCINGLKVESRDVRALAPQDVLRVEYHDNPGLRYGDAEVIIDYIIRRREVGGTVSLDLSNSPTTVFGDDQVSIRLNHKKSEFALQYAVRYREPYHIWGDATEIFNFTDGHQLQRIEQGIPGNMSETAHRMSLNYSLVDADNYYFNATLRHTISDNNKKRKTNMFEVSFPDELTYVMQKNNSMVKSPSLDLYYLKTLKNKQSLIINVVGTYIGTNTEQTYLETKQEQLISDISSYVDGKKYSIIGEVIYEKVFDVGNLSAGLKHMQAWADNNYTGTIASATEMKQSEMYLYTEFRGKRNKFSYLVGIGGSRSWFQQKGGEDYEYYTFRPKLTLQYNFTNDMFLRIGGNIDNTSPGLSELSDVGQYIDTLQIKWGNPDLTPFLNYRANLLYEYRKGIFTGNFNINYQYSPDAIMADVLRENGKFILTNNNQQNWQKMNSEMTIRVGPVKRVLQFSVTGGVNHYISEGNTYSHEYTNWYFRASVMAMYKKFMAMFQINTRYNHFYGESLWGGEDIHMLMLRYNQGKFSVGAGIMLPFSDKYKRIEENRNKYVHSSRNSYANDFAQMLVLQFSWNFDFGRMYKGGQRKLNNSDTDSGIISGSK